LPDDFSAQQYNKKNKRLLFMALFVFVLAVKALHVHDLSCQKKITVISL
jgi:hypothetical protein